MGEVREAGRTIAIGVALSSVTGIAGWGTAGSWVVLADGAGQSGARTDGQVLALIEQLGSSEYSQRQKAHDELARLGIQAFDALDQAQRHSDAEVRKQAEYLLRAVRVVWVRDDDPEAVRQILRNYRMEDAEERELRFRELGQLPDHQGLVALCRLARFETSEDLARLAALYAMQPVQSRAVMRGPRAMRQDIEEMAEGGSSKVLQESARESETSPQDNQKLAGQILETVGQSRRTACLWLRAFAEQLMDPVSARDEWNQLTALGEEELRLHPDPLRRRIFKEFLRWQIETLPASSTDAESIRLMQRLVEYHEDSRDELLLTCEWLIRRQAPPLMELLVARFPQPFRSDPHLIYRHAESLVQQGEKEKAEELVRKVLKIEPDMENPFLHVELGMDLQLRGLFDWAEREYRSVIGPLGFDKSLAKPADEATDIEISDDQPTPAETPQALAIVPTHPPVEAMIRLGWMFHDLGRNRDSYVAFKMLVDWMDRDKNVIRLTQDLGRIPLQIRSQMHYSLSLALKQEKKFGEEREQLKKALEYDETNADILISMYRMEDADDAWKTESRKLIDELRDHYRAQIGIAERSYRAMGTREETRELAKQLNQYAWLVANTYGDYQEALASSQRSLELLPDEAGYLDTLARCYYALGQLEDAIKQQRRAVMLEPHSGLIRRQLNLFEAELAEKKS